MDPAPEIAPADAAEEIAAGALVVDVREQVEWDAGHISGAVLIPLGELGGRVAELPARPAHGDRVPHRLSLRLRRRRASRGGV